MNIGNTYNWLRNQLKGVSATFIAAVSVFLLCLTVTVAATEAFTRELERNVYGRVADAAVNINNILERRASTYELILINSANAFKLENELDAKQWREFISGMEIQERYPGTMGVGFTKLLKYNQLQQHVDKHKKDYSAYKVWPEGVRSDYAVVTYVDPPTSSSNSVLGYDMYSDVTRRNVMHKARDTGGVSVTPPLALVGEEDRQSQPGLIIYNAVYDRSNLKTEEERRSGLIGYSYAVVRANELVKGLFGDTYQRGQLSFKIYDNPSGELTEIYTSPNYSNITSGPYVSRVTNVPFFDKYLRVNVVAVSGEIFFTPLRVFLIGLLLSGLISVTVYTLLIRRLRTLKRRHNIAVEKTKNELLALASHQLRTPATGVKQYIGMVLQGYSGDISDEQRTMLEKAYKSNESQLGIINELLYVAKAEAKQLDVNPEQINVTSLIKEVVESSSLQAKDKNIRLVYKTKKKIMAEIDPRYIGMSVSNLINNAIKYSHDGGRVVVKVEESSDAVAVRVNDSGVGIEAQHIPDLFKKFTRLPNAYSQKEGGSGLGLFLAKRIAEAHGGDILAKSIPGKSTVFSLSLPKKQKKSSKRNELNRIAHKRRVDLSDDRKKYF